jgi:acetyltransferase-like isoleucine patch superfamily enzyme
MAGRRLLALPRRLAREVRDRAAAVRLARTTVAGQTPPPARCFSSWGAGSFIVPPARVELPEHIEVGRDVIVHEHAWLALQRHPGLPAPVLRLGDGTKVNRFVKIECAGSVVLGEGVLVADRVLISDTDHPALPSEEGPAIDLDPAPRPITIGARAFIGAGAVIKSGVTIGEHAYISANTVVVRDVPARTLVAGSPARAVRQWDEPSEDAP